MGLRPPPAVKLKSCGSSGVAVPPRFDHAKVPGPVPRAVAPAHESLPDGLRRLFSYVPRRRRWQLGGLVLLMLTGILTALRPENVPKHHWNWTMLGANILTFALGEMEAAERTEFEQLLQADPAARQAVERRTRAA